MGNYDVGKMQITHCSVRSDRSCRSRGEYRSWADAAHLRLPPQSLRGRSTGSGCTGLHARKDRCSSCLVRDPVVPVKGGLEGYLRWTLSGPREYEPESDNSNSVRLRRTTQWKGSRR